MIKILLIEDDAELAELVHAHLSELGFAAALETIDDGLLGFQIATEDEYDIILLDVTLPGLDGFEICQKLRAQGQHTPIIMLTGKDAEADRVRGIQLGADDYLVKPISIPELIARIRALLRRSKIDPLSSENTIAIRELHIGPLRIDTQSRRVWLREAEISLSRSEFELLLLLMSRPGEVFSRQELLQEIWGYTSDSYAHILNPHITRLRKKIEQDPSNPKLLITDWGNGYRFANAGEFEEEYDRDA